MYGTRKDMTEGLKRDKQSNWVPSLDSFIFVFLPCHSSLGSQESKNNIVSQMISLSPTPSINQNTRLLVGCMLICLLTNPDEGDEGNCCESQQLDYPTYSHQRDREVSPGMNERRTRPVCLSWFRQKWVGDEMSRLREGPKVKPGVKERKHREPDEK